ncbi:MAG: ATP-binding cassette domain-containing protein [Treponema sp.]|nr:ATP-binding cassette domain-containing protein [Treponema sp.]
MVRALSFSKTYSKKSKAACVDVTLSAERGKITVLLGPNGAGKSTLLKAFCAQHYATSGKILAERSDGAIFDAAQSPEEVKAMTGFVSEVPALYDDWTVIEFLEMAAALRLAENDCKAKTEAGIKTDCKAKTEAAQKAARLCKLDSVLNQKISTLSHGYKQRVNFAQALVADPEILILDEPATGLDPEQIRETRKLVQDLKKSRAVIFSTHIIQEAASLSDTIYIIKDGRVAASGSPSELMKKSGSKNLEDAYLFFVSDPRASSNFDRSNDSSMSNDPRGSSNLSPASDCGMSNDSAASTDSSLATDSRSSTDSCPATVSTAVNAPAFWGLARKELFSYAINPFYWISGIVFCAFSAAAFFWGTRFFTQGQGSAALSPFFLAMPYLCSILIPALCMNIKSRAFDKCLPFDEIQKAAARVLAALTVFVFYLIPTSLVPLCVNIFGSVDFGAVMVSYAGLSLYAAAAISFCVFMSSFFKNRAAYFAASALFLSGLNSIHNILNFIQAGDFLSSAIRSASFAWRFDSASKGILDSRDFLFFALASLLFVTLTAFVLEHKKGKKYFCKKRAARSWTLIFIFVFLALNSTRIYKRLDFSAGKIYTPSKRTTALLSSAKEKIRISYYRSDELLKLYPQVRDVGDFLRSLSFSSKNVVYTEHDADKEASQKILRGLNVPPFQIQKQKNNSMEFVDSYSAIVIDCMDKTLFIPAAFSTFGLEYDINLRLDYLLSQKSRRAYVLCGNGMDDKKDFKAALDWLNIEGFETLSPKRGGGLEQSLDPTIPLALFGTSALDAAAANAIENFLESGGALFVATSPYKSDVDGDWSLSKNKGDFILPLLEQRGISFMESLAADISCVRAAFRSTDDGGNDRNVNINYPLWISALSQEAAPFGATVFWASPINIDEKKARPLLLSSPASWRFLPDKKSGGALFDTNPFTVPKTALDDILVQKKRSVLAAQTLDKKITAVSGELFANDLLLSLSGGESGDFRNLNFLTASLLELCGESEMAALKNKGGADFSLWKISSAADWQDAKAFSLLANFALPPLYFLLVFVLFRAKRLKKSKRRSQA